MRLAKERNNSIKKNSRKTVVRFQALGMPLMLATYLEEEKRAELRNERLKMTEF